MSAKIFLVVCASALFVQNVVSQCLAPASLVNIGGCSAGLSASGGGFSILSSSPINPNGVSVLSQNSIDGCLDVSGMLPLLATVALEGQVPSSGSAGVSYSCGDSNVGISSQSLSAAGYGASNAAVLGGLGGLGGLNAGLAGSLAGSSCGCRSIC